MNDVVRLATVTGVGANGGALLRFDGEETARQKEYVCVGNVSDGDRVCVLESSGSWIVLGSIGGGGGGSGGLPVGAIVSYGGSTAPDGWLLCDGSAVSRAEQASLFSAIGTEYGAGDGSLTFNLPNLQGRVPVGQDSSTEFNALGRTGGEKAHSLTKDENGRHAHSQATHSHGFDNDVVTSYGSALGQSYTGGNRYLYNAGFKISSTEDARPTIYDSGSGDPHNNLQPYTVVNYIIKT